MNTNNNHQTQSLDLTALNTSSYQIQSFIQQFQSKINHNNKTFFIIQENFIKKFRFKNNLQNNQQQDKYNSLNQFIHNFKQTINYYQSYHQHIQSTLQKYSFCKGINKFCRDLYKSQQKTLSFFVNQIQLHRALVQQNQIKYQSKIQHLKDTCINCKQHFIRKSFQNLKQNVSYQFNDSYKMYKKQKQNLIDKNTQNMVQNIFRIGRQNEQKPLEMTLQDFEYAQSKMKRLMKQSKKINDDALQQIFDRFEHKQQLEMYSVNKVKINQMFYDLQNELDKRATQIQQYIQDMLNFNQKLINYNPNHINKKSASDLNNYNQQSQPDIVEKQLKFNFNKIIKKIYKKVLELYMKRKQQSISVECQVNFSQQNTIRQLEKQKKKLTLQLKQSQQDKKYITNNLKQQNEKLKKQFTQIHQQKVKLQIAKQQAYSDKNNIQKQADKLIKVVSQMKKQIQRLTYLLQRQKKINNSNSNRKDSKMMSNGSNQTNKKVSRFNDQLTKQRDSKQGDKLSQGQNIKTTNYQLQRKQKKGGDQQLLEQLQRNELQLFKSLAKKRLKSRKKYMQPRRSKLLQTITLQQSQLKHEMSKFSNSVDNEGQNNQDQDNKSNMSNQQHQINTLSDEQNILSLKVPQNQRSQISIENKQKLSNKQQNINQTNKQSNYIKIQIKNHKSKTFTQLYKINQQKIQSHGHSSRQISQTSQDIHKQLQQLQQIKKMKQIQIKLASLTKKKEPINTQGHRSTIGFHIQKQVQQSVQSQKVNRFNSIAVVNHKKPINSNITKQNDDLVKRFGKTSGFQNSAINRPRISIKRLQQINMLNNKERKSSVSIQSKNYINLYDQIYRQIQQNRCNVGTQLIWQQQQILKMLFSIQLKNRKWNQSILTYQSFKFGYQQFLNQLNLLIIKQQKNPIRKLNSYKGSSSVLKNNHNYRFNKQNLFNNTYRYIQNQTISNNINQTFAKTADEKLYFIPKSINQNKQSNLNKTFSNFYHNNPKSNNQNNANDKMFNCVTIADFKNIQTNYTTFNQVNPNSTSQGFRKKGFYTMHHVRTQAGNNKQTQQQKYFMKQQNQDRLLPIINQTQQLQIIRIPSFQKQDAQSLFFSIQSAKIFEQKISNLNTNQTSLLALQQHQIRFSTQILAILAHIHLSQIKSYQQIKSLLLYPVRVLSNNNGQIGGNQMVQKQAELSLKKGLGYIIQLHRKCMNIPMLKQKSRSRDSSKLQMKKSGRCVCEHLLRFKRKISEVIHASLSIKNKNELISIVQPSNLLNVK